MMNINRYDAVSVNMLIDDLYLNYLDINTNAPLSLIMLHDSINTVKDSLLEKTIDKLIQNKIPKMTGMSVKELLDLPTYELKMYLRSSVKLGIKDSKVINKISEELE